MTLLTPGWLPTQPVPMGPDATRLNMRLMLQNQGLQEGVMGATDMKVAQRGAGANQSADVAAGFAWVLGDATAKQGFYPVYNDATANVAATAAHATNPRIDCLVVHVYDSSISGASDVPLYEIVAGTATGGATLDNRTGAPAIPSTALLLADLLRPAANNNITTANIRDRRPWARGAFNVIQRTANAAAGSDYAISAGTFALIDSTNLAPRIECSGAPIRMRLIGRGANSSGSGGSYLTPWVDGAAIASQTDVWALDGPGANFAWPIEAEWVWTPAAGSHTLGWAARAATGTFTIKAAAATPLVFTIEELVRQNANNS